MSLDKTVDSYYDGVNAFQFDESAKRLSVLDQTQLPKAVKYVDVPDSEMGYKVIKSMMVRGAPCIAAVGCLAIIAELNQSKFLEDKSLSAAAIVSWLHEKSRFILGSRPTAVNLKNALDKLIGIAEYEVSYGCDSHLTLIKTLSDKCNRAIESGKVLNRVLAEHGANDILFNASDKLDGVTILTHCNTGALATVGYGTALGVVRSLKTKGKLKQVYCTETRPYNQGSRLTAWELVQENIPATLIADSMVAYLMATHQIDAVIVGTDCVARNGDTANKIGTLQIAIVAKHYDVPFYVAAPTQSIDVSKIGQEEINIELRSPEELRRLGEIELAPKEVDVWNPSFDVTPAALITAFITEYGVIKPNAIRQLEDMKRSQPIDAMF